ncbi:MAG TPA: hemolysin family protein [Desulfohalobiaceae bacterium]|nr:hemolysin family protein [Desulfohalobiaceae bacterium]
METLLISVVLVLLISGFCSLSEAVLYSVPWSYIEKLRESGKKSGAVLYKLRLEVDEPITAILTLNTISHTAGAAVAGAAAVSVFGEESLLYFSLLFTALILILSEILPKTVGVLHNRFFASLLARPLMGMVIVLLPIIKALSFFVNFLTKRKGGPETSEEDIMAMVSLTRKTGVLKHFEEESIQNILTLDNKTIREVMTPRTVMFSLPAEKTVSEVWDSRNIWPYSRVPVYDNGDPEDIVGIVYRREVLETLASDQYAKPISSLMKPVHFILETLTLDRVLVTFLESRLHLAVVLDEYGGVSGLITLEDILEEILGKEIMDETDQVADMRKLALERRQKLLHSES